MNIYPPSHLCSCIQCNVEMSSKGINTHYIRKHTNTSIRPTGKNTNKFIITCSCLTCKKTTTVQSLEQHIARCTKPLNLCMQCTVSTTTKFCSKSCAAKYNNSLRPANHISRVTINSMRGKSQRPAYTKISWCKICNILIKNSKRVTCSNECKMIAFQKRGQNSAATIVKRSKDEIALFELCNQYFNSVRNNIQLINGWDADIIIDDFKLAVLWNGPWHYQQMPHKNHSLKQVQNRDKLKINALSSAGWQILIFEDRYFTPHTAFESILKQTLDSNQDKR